MSLSAKIYFYFLFLLCIISLLSLIIIREKFSDGLLIGSDSYKSLRFANEFSSSSSISYDSLSYGGKPFIEEKAWYILLSIYPVFLSRFLPFIFGLLSFIVFYLLVSKIKPEIKFVSSFLLIISPAFLYLFSTSTKYSASIFFILLGFYMFAIDRKLFGFISFFFTGFFSILSLLVVLFLFFCYCLKKEKFDDFYIIFIGFIFVFLIQFYSIFTLGLSQSVLGFTKFSFSGLISFVVFGFGGKYGFGFFMLFLAFIGIYKYYNIKLRFLFVYLFIFLLLFLSYYFNFLLSYLSFIIAFFAAFGLMPFIFGEWKERSFKFLTLLVIFCGLLFSLLVFYNQVSSFEPTPSFFEGIRFLEDKNSEGTVLADYRFGNYINYIGKKTLLDENFLYAPEPIVRKKDIDFLFNNIDINLTVSLLNKHDVGYIFIDNRLKKEVFNNEDKGFMFLLKYSPALFFKAFNNTEVDVWYNRNIKS